jgi:hypothetical protein
VGAPCGEWAAGHPRLLAMSTQLTVPAGFVSYLRGSLFGEWGYAAEQLSSLALEFGGNAPDGAYLAPLHTFFTTYLLLAEIGLREDAAQGEVVVNLSIGGTHVVKGLKDEHRILLEQLDEMPRRTRKAMRDAASAKVAEFGDFVQAVEERVDGLNRSPERPATTHPPSRPLRAQPSRARRTRR